MGNNHCAMIFLIINLFLLFIKAFALIGLDEVNKFICLADNLEYVELQEQDNIVSTVLMLTIGYSPAIILQILVSV